MLRTARRVMDFAPLNRQQLAHATRLLLDCLCVLWSLSTIATAGDEKPRWPFGMSPKEMLAGVETPFSIEDYIMFAEPVAMFTGHFDYAHTDLDIAGRDLDLSFERHYQSGTLMDGPLGKKWDFGWNQFVALAVRNDPAPAYAGPHAHVVTGGAASTSQYRNADAYFYDGRHRIDKFSMFTDGGFHSWRSAKGYFAKLRHEPQVDPHMTLPVRFVMRSADGTILTFEDRDLGYNPFVYAPIYRLSKIQDRKGNTTTLVYENKTFGAYDYKRLDYVTDSLGRVVDLSYDDQSQHPELIRSITDFAGRTVAFEYDGESNLIATTGASIVGTPTGNDFPLGRKTRYEYATVGTHEHLLTKIFDANESGAGGVPYLQNTYDPLGRVIEQIYGGTNVSGVSAGGTYALVYKQHDFPGVLTSVEGGVYFKARETLGINPNGDLLHVCFDENGKGRQTFRYTGRFDPTSLMSTMTIEDVLNGRTPPLRGDDPAFYETQKDYNDDGLITEVREPGTRVKKAYYSGPDVFQRGNLLKVERFAVPADASPPITTLMAYEPIYNQVRVTVDARGLDPNHLPPNGGVHSAARYTTRTIFDYQEGTFASSAASALKAAWVIDTVQDAQFDLLEQLDVDLLPIEQSCALGDQNGDGTDTQEFGNAIVVIDPTVRVYSNVDSPTSSYEDQPVVTKRRYNSFSRLIGVTDPVGIATSYEYFPTSDPCGQSGSTVSSSTGGGFLAKKLLPESVTESLRYDVLGRQTLYVNGRGAETNTTYNAAGEVVQVENDRGYLAQSIFDAAGRVIARKRTNKEPVFDAGGSPTGAEQSGASGALIVDTFVYDLNNKLIEENIQAFPRATVSLDTPQ